MKFPGLSYVPDYLTNYSYGPPILGKNEKTRQQELKDSQNCDFSLWI